MRRTRRGESERKNREESQKEKEHHAFHKNTFFFFGVEEALRKQKRKKEGKGKMLVFALGVTVRHLSLQRRPPPLEGGGGTEGAKRLVVSFGCFTFFFSLALCWLREGARVCALLSRPCKLSLSPRWCVLGLPQKETRYPPQLEEKSRRREKRKKKTDFLLLAALSSTPEQTSVHM